jgi:hypothetical protein
MDLEFLDFDSDIMMYAVIGLLFLWLFLRIFKRTEKPRVRAQVSGRSSSWDDGGYSR